MLHITNRFGRLTHFPAPKCARITGRTFSAVHGRAESVFVPVGGSGSVQLDITYPTQRAHEQPSVLINLPSSSSIFVPSAADEPSDALPSHLSTSFPRATLISVNYRLAITTDRSSVVKPGDFRYPQPIHDATVAFNHTLEEIIPNLFPVPQADSPSWQADTTPRVTLVGSHIGASLATMLALTQPNDIHSVAISDPMVDWVILDELYRPHQAPATAIRAKRSYGGNHGEDPAFVASAAKRLIDIRTRLFASPSAYFDPFASPALFLRAPGRDTPRTHAEALGLLDDEMGFEDTEIDERLGIIAKEHYNSMQEEIPNPVHRSPTNLDTITEAIGADSFGPYDDDNHPSPKPSPAPEPKQVKRRKVLRRWPPISTLADASLPWFIVFTSSPFQTQDPTDAMNALLEKQGIELADLLRRACFYGREKGVGEERVSLSPLPGMDDRTVKGKRDREEWRLTMMVGWLRQRMEQDGWVLQHPSGVREG